MSPFTSLRNTKFVSALVPLLFVTHAWASDIVVTVKDQNASPVKDAVLSVTRVAGGDDTPAPGQEIVDQINKEFVPHVQAIVAGSSMSFPNKDNIRHHVYSFSKAKKFELPLYIGTPARPVVFDKAGVVVLGCNIHDWMRGYIYILDTPFFAQSDDEGTARIHNLSSGDYDVELWHPRDRSSKPQQRRVTLNGSDTIELDLELELKPVIRIRRAPRARSRGYR